MIKESFFYMVITNAWTAFSRLWASSFIKAFFCAESSMPIDSTLFAKFIKLLNAVFAFISEKTSSAVKGSFICRVLFKSVYPTVLVTIVLIPIVPTKYVLALCVLCVFLFLAKWIFSGEIALRFELMDFFVVLFAMLLIFSVFISYVPSDSAIMASTYILFILFYFVVKNTIDTRQKLIFTVYGLLLAGTLVSLFGIYQRITGAYYTLTESWVDTDMFENSIRIYSTLGNPNVLGEYLLFIIPMAYAGLYFSKLKFFPTAILAVSGACMLLTQSRGAWVGLVAVFGIYALAKDKKLIILGVIALLFMPLMLPATIIDRIASIGDLSDSSSYYRLSIWLASLSMVRDYWPIGIGLGTSSFVFIFQKYAFGASYAAHSHNFFLQLIIDLGIVGILLIFAIIYVYLKGVLSKVGAVKDKFLAYGGTAVCAGMIGYLVQGLTDNVWYNYRIVAFFWVMVAISCVFASLMERGLDEENI